MSNYFYYIGFLYMADSIRMLWVSFNPPKVVDQKKVLKINDGMDVGELMNAAQTHRENNKSNKLQYIVGFIFFIWTMIGYVGNTPEKYWFLSDMVFIICHWTFVISIGVFFAFNSVFKNKEEKTVTVNDTNTKKSSIVRTIDIEKIAGTTELIIVSIILYQHFLAN